MAASTITDVNDVFLQLLLLSVAAVCCCWLLPRRWHCPRWSPTLGQSAADRHRRCSQPRSLLQADTAECLEAIWDLTNKLNLAAIRTSTLKKNHNNKNKKTIFLQVTRTKKIKKIKTKTHGNFSSCFDCFAESLVPWRWQPVSRYETHLVLISISLKWVLVND